MTLKSKVLSLIATLCTLAAGLLHAQAFGAARAVTFTTSFPFYISGEQMPAGSYVMTQPDINSDYVLIRDTESSHSAFIFYTPIQRIGPIAQGEVTFRQYGDTDYLGEVTITGEKTGLTVPESPAEKRTARANHEVASVRIVALHSKVHG